MTTARDYKLISEALRKAKPVDPLHYTGWHDAAEAVGEALKKRSGMFDVERFMRDCGAVATERCNETRP